MKRSLDIAAIVLTSLLLLGFAVLSLRGLIDPQPASARFGAPVSDAAGACSTGSIFPAIWSSSLRARSSWSHGSGRRWPF